MFRSRICIMSYQYMISYILLGLTFWEVISYWLIIPWSKSHHYSLVPYDVNKWIANVVSFWISFSFIILWFNVQKVIRNSEICISFFNQVSCIIVQYSYSYNSILLTNRLIISKVHTDNGYPICTVNNHNPRGSTKRMSVGVVQNFLSYK